MERLKLFYTFMVFKANSSHEKNPDFRIDHSNLF